MAREIKFSLVYRDMWQSSGKLMPRKDQLVRVAEPIVAMGCFERIETNGGGFEQINLLYGENPNHSVRAWTKAFREAGIQTHMLERGLNGIRMSPVPKDVRKLMFKLKKIQGTDIARSFDGLNNPQNLALSFQYAKEGGMIPQGALSITHSPIHTVEYYIDLADKFIDLGAEEICLKDMAGIGRPVSIGKITKGIRERHPNIIIQYHGHSTPGFSIVSALESARHGADYVDVGMEPLSWGTGHADLLTVHAMLKDAGFLVPDINMDAYMEARTLTKEFMDDFLKYFINDKNRYMNSLLIGPGLPGGMMGSLMADLEGNLKSYNKSLAKQNKPAATQDDLLLELFKEVEYVWPRLGYPPLVTPFSQYVKNVSLMNVLQMAKGKERFSMIDENTWGMILGKSGKLLGELDPEILKLVEEQKREFFTGNPQDLYPDELDLYRQKMDERGWDYGPDDEELFEFAMHPQQYLEFKSGKAKEKFLKDLEKRKADHLTKQGGAVVRPETLNVEMDGEVFKVKISWNSDDQKEEPGAALPMEAQPSASNGQFESISSPLEGTFYLTRESTERGIKVGDKIKEGDTVAYIESMKVMNAIVAETSGTVAEILVNNGDEVEEDDVIIKLK